MNLWITFWRNWFWPIVALCVLYFAMMIWPGNKWDSIENDVVRIANKAIQENGFESDQIIVSERGRDLLLTGNVVSQTQKDRLLNVVSMAVDESGLVAPRVVAFEGTIQAPVKKKVSAIEPLAGDTIVAELVPELVPEIAPEIAPEIESSVVTSPTVAEPEIVLTPEKQACQQGLVDVMNSTNIYFATSRADIEVDSFETLDQISNILQQCPDAEIEVAGHTDSAGDAEFNLSLSEQRAASVANYLQSKPSLKNKIVAVGYGETQPIADNSTTSGQAQNRRIQFIVK